MSLMKLLSGRSGALGLVALATPLLICGCAKKKSDSTTDAAGGLTLSGVLSSGLNGARIDLARDFLVAISDHSGSIFSSVNGAKVDKVMAVPVYQGKLNPYAMPYAVNGTVGTDGKMTISLGKDQDYVLLLIDSSQTRKIDQVVAYLTLADSTKGLKKLPVKSTKGDSLDVGTVTSASGSANANSSKTLSDLSSQFEVDVNVLREVAKTDDVLQMAKNLYANFVSASNYASTEPYFAFNGNQSLIYNTYSDPASNPVYSGYGLYMNLAKPGLKLQDLCGSSAKVLTMTPPATITDGVDLSNPNAQQLTHTVLDNSHTAALAQRSSSNYWCGADYNAGLGSGAIYLHGQSPTSEEFGFNWGAGTGFAGAIAAGQWVMALDGTEIARFDLKATSILDSNGKPLIYIPSVKVDKDSNDLITGISVKLYTYDTTTSSYVAVTDASTFLSIAQSLYVEVTDYGQTPTVSSYSQLTSAPGGVFSMTSFDHAWKKGTYGAGTASNPATTSIAVSYSLYGATMRFDFR